ncbi:hypothetical protein A4G99_21570 [Haladaptatus sp. R4]|uniref:DUF7344 domain-containing protein n=1 Tax=Haladaptatus sp. R4 TaxID=1679489 RepID=UPI0007B46B32|nr:hypothetical protein [Haladaptatus sp. R4]KZN26389.1 hypothetical protein A4G99_21570 [Haladaptatus sp. R4]
MGNDSEDILYEILLDTSLDDDVYRALSSTPRRYTLYTLLEWDRISLDELADVLTGWLYASEYRMATAEDREQLLAELQRQHIRMLRKSGLVDYDPREELLVKPEFSPSVTRLLHWALKNEYGN